MESQQSHPQAPPPPTPKPDSSCRKKRSEGASFVADMREHVDEFFSASMDEHKTCFKKTIEKMFGMSKIVAEKNSLSVKEVESSLPLKTTVTE
ncbi:hypothetical protein MKW98_003021 [Papaver atlanticum]|uniref:Uncharacterized protein n=1 Tax=Papaver atlanticum TaxID=357466 RepID=A0AAD4RYZ9_9MAGN|nr:hypothetical protein MKW98_029982 [Papaver atlanticum]KAI3960522.1 hypothetical protein MKW98_003021 [Papaver atlanticum]